MIIMPTHFVRFIDGRAGSQINIAFLPGALGAYLGTLETAVALRLDYARKLLFDHRIKYEGFDYIQETIDRGMCFRDSGHRLKFLYVKNNIKPEIYFLLIKTDRRRKELWLVTFHRIQKKQYTNRLDPQNLLREHSEQEFMG